MFFLINDEISTIKCKNYLCKHQNILFLLKVKRCIIVFGLQPDFNLIVSVHEDYWTFGHDLMNSYLFCLDLSTCLN